MPDGTEEWTRICEQAAKEQDPEKLMILTQRIIELLDQRIRDARENGETLDLKT
jgi:hypothetical protein